MKADKVRIVRPVQGYRWTVVTRGKAAKLERKILAGYVTEGPMTFDTDLQYIRSDIAELDNFSRYFHYLGSVLDGDA
jgi:hypothetical protein